MGKIKCRVWDRYNQCYIYSDNEDYLFALTTDGGLEVWHLDRPLDIIDHLPPEWCTGMKDKDGVDIYEGDRVRHKASVYGNVVTWHGGAFRLGDGPWGHALSNRLEGCEVIGNTRHPRTLGGGIDGI